LHNTIETSQTKTNKAAGNKLGSKPLTCDSKELAQDTLKHTMMLFQIDQNAALQQTLLLSTSHLLQKPLHI